jgi:hypothetical protein
MIRSSRLAIALVFATALTPSLARSGDWEPLAIGNRWEYRGTGGSHQVEHITGTFTLRGRVVAIKHYDEGLDAGLDNFWLLDPDGSVLLAGFMGADGFGIAYEPPIRYLNGPPAVGAKLPQFVTAYNLQTNAVEFAGDLQRDITESVVLNLPAGSFSALGSGQLATAGPALAGRRAFALDGRALPSTSSTVSGTLTTDWYSDGVGVVQYNTSDLYQLVGFGQPTATLATNWGAIKRLYR